MRTQWPPTAHPPFENRHENFGENQEFPILQCLCMHSACGVARTLTKLSKMNLSDKIDAFSYIGHLHSFKIHWYRHANSDPTNIEKYLTNSSNFAQKSRKLRQGCAKTWKYQKILRIEPENSFQKLIRCPNTLYLRFHTIWLTTDACRRIFNRKYVKNSSFSAQIPYLAA